MCDHAHYSELEDRVGKMETAFAVMGEQIRGLVSATNNLKHVVYAFTLLLLLTVIWGAIGPEGFNAVTHKGTTINKQTKMEIIPWDGKLSLSHWRKCA